MKKDNLKCFLFVFRMLNFMHIAIFLLKFMIENYILTKLFKSLVKVELIFRWHKVTYYMKVSNISKSWYTDDYCYNKKL